MLGAQISERLLELPALLLRHRPPLTCAFQFHAQRFHLRLTSCLHRPQLLKLPQLFRAERMGSTLAIKSPA